MENKIEIREEYAKMIFEGGKLVGMFKRDEDGVVRTYKIQETDYTHVQDIFGVATLHVNPPSTKVAVKETPGL